MFYPKSKTVRKTSGYIVPRKRCDIQRERVFDLVESFSSSYPVTLTIPMHSSLNTYTSVPRAYPAPSKVWFEYFSHSRKASWKYNEYFPEPPE